MAKKTTLFLAFALGILLGPLQGQAPGEAAPGVLPQWTLPGLVAQDDPWSDGIVGAGLLLRRLDGVKRVLLIGAHPDDEDTSLLAALSRGMGVETAYLSLSRGEGGQNLIGPELDEGLGLVRTGELLAARALDGGRQYFTRAFDFGYSKSAEETFRYWPREELLRDITWVVRSFRPQVIVSVFSGASRDGHGHHQVAGILAYEVFDVAGDPSRFPEQIEAGAPAWTPLKLYRLTRRNPQEATTRIETGAFDPLLGRSHYQVAMESRSQHRSQDMGAAQPMGPRRTSVALVRSRVQAPGPDEIFSGVDTALVSLAADLPPGIRSMVTERLREYRAAIRSGIRALDVAEPWAGAPHLMQAVNVLKETLDLLSSEVEGRESGSDLLELERTLQGRLVLVQEALLRAGGMVADLRVEDDLLVPGETVEGVFSLWNGGPLSIQDASAVLMAPDEWVVSGEVSTSKDLAPGSLAEWSFRVELPATADPSRAYFLKRPRDGELYQWPEDPMAWGLPADPDLLHARLTFTLGAQGGEVKVSRPARYRGVDKATGEFRKPVQVVPALAVSLDPGLVVWPVSGHGSREVTVTLSSQAESQLEGRVGLDLPDGWGSDPEETSFSLSEPGDEAAFSFQVTRPEGTDAGEYVIAADVRTRDGRRFQEGVSLVDYPHILRGLLFPRARSKVSVFPVSMSTGLRVGYVMGSGDDGAEAIDQMGAEVELLGPEELRAGDLSRFSVLVLGIRAYETRPDLVAVNHRILEFARAGGTVVVQYNKYEYPRGGFAPYEVGMSRPHDRVSDESVPVRILEPDHPVFHSPNLIGPHDFDGWVQERGLYFLGSWGPEFTPLLEMADPGEDPKRGGLLMAPVGEGVYVYTGLAFFRQFSEGVPGAYRLFANLLALRADDLR